MSKQFKQITDKMLDIYKAKNEDYGNSFSEIYRKFGLISAVSQISHKTARLESFVKQDDLKVKDESLTDTLLDLANYCILTVMELEGSE